MWISMDAVAVVGDRVERTWKCIFLLSVVLHAYVYILSEI